MSSVELELRWGGKSIGGKSTRPIMTWFMTCSLNQVDKLYPLSLQAERGRHCFILGKRICWLGNIFEVAKFFAHDDTISWTSELFSLSLNGWSSLLERSCIILGWGNTDYFNSQVMWQRGFWNAIGAPYRACRLPKRSTVLLNRSYSIYSQSLK